MSKKLVGAYSDEGVVVSFFLVLEREVVGDRQYVLKRRGRLGVDLGCEFN